MLQRKWIMEQIPPKSMGSDNKFVSFGERLRLERLRIGMQQVDLAEACEVSRKTLSVWEKGEQTPNAAVLAVMAGHGVDVLYVVTGQRAGEAESTLAPAERDLLQAWRLGDEKGRTALAAMAAALKPE
ncbi:helix-turn-helix domain-containing protein [Comamonas sp. CMM01]|uniref:helix-turn-helix domain-containing protein n=1 Tax=Comamonas sp. CMM01 TaxID=2769280 RepID=UPI001CE21D93|nr:helix-turn-helix transcriptional regulator [Comamonas sp. CMM01]